MYDFAGIISLRPPTSQASKLHRTMDEGSRSLRGKKCAAVPPILVETPTPRSPRADATPSLKEAESVASLKAGSQQKHQHHHSCGDDAIQTLASVAGNNCKLPLIHPQGGILNNAVQPPSSGSPGGIRAQAAGLLDPLLMQHHHSPLKHLSDTLIKQEPSSQLSPGFAAATTSACSVGHSVGLAALHHPLTASNTVPPSSSSAMLQQRELPNSLFLQKQLRAPNLKLSPLSISASVSSGGVHQLQLPNGIPGHLATPSHLQAQSPAYSDISSIRLTPQSPFSHAFSVGTSEGQPLAKHTAAGTKARLKSETAYSGKMHLPPLSATAGYTSNGSNTDIEDAASPLIPPLHSFSPYLGSGISEVPSFPSLLSPSSPIHLPKKRALSISPNNSDMLDFSCIRSSPNSLIAALSGNSGSNPTLTNGVSPAGGSVGHLVGNLSPAVPQLQYKLQQRRVSVEHNQNSDGTSNMTITNQLTFSEHLKEKQKFNAKSDDQSNLAVQVQQDDQNQQIAEPMEFDNHSIKSSVTSSTTSHQSHSHSQMKEELSDPLTCLWEGCGQTCDHLDDLVQHIENAHIEKGKSDDFTCLWQNCIRRRKPFNARYKLLIHMRIHSGEKPNKCNVS